LYTPASSAVSNPISTFSSAQRGTVARTWSKTFGLSLDAQPAAFTCAVSFFNWVLSITWLGPITGRPFTAVFYCDRLLRPFTAAVNAAVTVTVFAAAIYYNSGMRRTSLFSAVVLLAAAFSLVSREPKTDPRLKKAYRAAEHNGWIQVHLEGSPAEIGFQHGYLLAAEIQDDFVEHHAGVHHPDFQRVLSRLADSGIRRVDGCGS